MYKKHFVSFSWKLVVIIFFLLSTTSAQSQRQVKKWEVYEVLLRAKGKYENPYAAIPVEKQDLVSVTFTGTRGAAQGKTLTLVGFWDGGQDWKVRFAPPETGTWEYKSISRDKGLNNVKGKIEVSDWQEAEKQENPTYHGLVQVRKSGAQPGRFFEYTDGTPFLWIADTWWNWTKRGIKFTTFQKVVDDRAAKGFNLGQLFVAANGWGRVSSLLDETYSVLDIGHMQKVDSMVAYANSKGLTVWVHGWWARKDLDKTAGEEKMKRWWRYLIHRLGAYNVIWVGGGEYNLDDYGGLGLDFWKDLGKMIKEEDPYNRIVGMHNTPPTWGSGMQAPQWSTAEVLHRETWLDYNQTQPGHGKMNNELIPDIIRQSYAATPAKPIVVTEPWYEFIEGNPTDYDIRFGAWSAILSGAAGHTYGGGHVWLAHVPEAPGGGGSWPLEKGFERNTLDYPGAVSMGHLSGFFKNIKWWEMAPHPELVLEYPDQYCLAAPGQEYVVYLRWAHQAKVDLGSTDENDVFEYSWFDPSNGKLVAGKNINGGKVHLFRSPGPNYANFKDWVLHIRKK
jgi:hypothetical protein